MTRKYDSVLLDIDNTLTNLQPTLDIMAEVFGVEPVTIEDIHSFTLSDAYGVTAKKEETFWAENELRLTQESVLEVDRVKQMLQEYTHEDTIIYVVTMRPEDMYEATFYWLRANGIHFDHLICLGQESKVDYAMHFGIEAIFEDNPAVFEEVEDKGLEDEFDLFVVDYPFNRHITNAIRLDRYTGKEVQKVLQEVR